MRDPSGENATCETRGCGGIVTVDSAPSAIRFSAIAVIPVPGRPDARNGPLVLAFTRSPASRSIGCESSAIVGYARAFSSASVCRFGLTSVCGSGSASNAWTMVGGGSA